jgi:hypothetical protein
LRAEAIGGIWRRSPVKSGRAARMAPSSGIGALKGVMLPSASRVSETAPNRAVAV